MLNDKGLPLPSVVVAVKGTSTVTTTNSDGNFLVAVEAINPVLVFTCAGYQALAVEARSGVAVTLYAVGVAPPSSVEPAVGAGSNGVVYAEEMASFPAAKRPTPPTCAKMPIIPKKSSSRAWPGPFS